MADTQRTTFVFAWRFNMSAAQLQSSSPKQICQGWRIFGPHQDFAAFALPLLLPQSRPNAELVVAVIVVVMLVVLLRSARRATVCLKQENNELSAKLREQKNRAESERRAAECESIFYQRIAELKQEIARLERASQGAQRAGQVLPKIHLTLPLDGREVFLPSLDPNRVYKITVQGICTFRESTGLFSTREASADAVYRTDNFGNFVVRHDCLKLKETPASRFLKNVPREAMPEEDREAHRYSFRIDGVPTKISARFCLDSRGLDELRGPLTLTVELLPLGTASPAAGERRDEAAREKAGEAERAARESAKRAEQVAKETTALSARFESLLFKAQCERHFLDEDFQRDVAKRDPAEILKIRRPEWRKEYRQFMKDTALKSFVEEQAPEIMQWFEARKRIDELAERMMVAPPSAPKVLTAEEVRAEMIQKKAVRYKNMIAEKKLKAQMITEGRVALDEIEGDEDDKEDLKADLTEEIRDDGRGPQNVEASETL